MNSETLKDIEHHAAGIKRELERLEPYITEKHSMVEYKYAEFSRLLREAKEKLMEME